MENHARDSVTSLLYHGWDETKTRAWADPTTGCSPSFWGRALGWYTMGLVDILDYLPVDHIGRPQIIAILQRLAVGIKKYQDSTHGTWYQVVDKAYLSDNWRESSASCIFVYALAKGARLGYIEQSYLSVAKKGYTGILNEFVSINSDSSISLTGICSTAGLDTAANGPRNGSYDYYVNYSGTQPMSNDGKGTGPFLMASVELERIGFVVPPLNFHSTVSNDSVFLVWTDKTYNAISFRVERKSDLDSQFTEIGYVPKGKANYIDDATTKGMHYLYRIRVKSITDSSEYSTIESVTIPSATLVYETVSHIGSFELLQNYPNPFNPITQIEFRIKEKGFTTLQVCDILGRDVAILFSGYAVSGKMYRAEFQGSQISSGIYFCVLQSGKQREIKKMLLLK
jgi:hypothetical protein